MTQEMNADSCITPANATHRVYSVGCCGVWGDSDNHRKRTNSKTKGVQTNRMKVVDCTATKRSIAGSRLGGGRAPKPTRA
ncbi:hypothetical protein J6590_011995, partial [Homalodisca vitripennis]